jgi:hypothetical protein
MRFFLRKKPIISMKTTYLKTGLLLAAAAMFTTASARADTYSWTNFQSDIGGVAQHVDGNLVNPWGMATPSATGPIWVSDNGTGVSTLYARNGTANTLVVEIPTAARNRGTANPTGVVFNGTAFFQVTQMEPRGQPVSSSSVKMALFQVGARGWMERMPSLQSITAQTTVLTAPFIKA